MTTSVPFLSVVVTARNDDHGGKLLQRMQWFVSSLLAQCDHYHVDAELVLVEWNPPPDRPRLADALKWPVDGTRCSIRIVEVPAEIHRCFKHADELPLFQMIGKNVGIRRARGRFVLSTNVDILFSDALVAFLADKRLRGDRMYRVDRYDVAPDLESGWSERAMLDYSRMEVIRINDRWGTRNLRTGIIKGAYIPVSAWGVLRDQLLDWLCPRSVRNHVGLHTNTCGDFTLLAAEKLAAIRGYPEFQMYSLHLDSLGCFAAYHAGARECVLTEPMRIYHLEHGVGSGYTPEGQAALYERLKAKGIPRLEPCQVYAWALEMRRNREASLFNSEDWGLRGYSLPETCFGNRGRMCEKGS